MYVPHAIAVMAGQDMRIRSSDNVMHNVHLLPFSNREKNFGMPGPGEVSQVFNAPEIFRVKCDIHPWMNAWVGVFDHPCFAVTGATGEYEITGIPPGKYTLKAWHEKYGDIKVEVELGEKAVLTLDITLEEK
jgi:hypothetical protein